MKPEIAIRIADESLEFRELVLPHGEINGAIILKSAGLGYPNAVLLQRLGSGELETIRLQEKPDLRAGNELIVGSGDRVYSFTLDHAQMVWPSVRISGAILRKLARLTDEVELVLLREDAEAQVIEDDATVNLAHAGVEQLVTRPRKWKLRVQAVTLEFDVPAVKVADAMRQAGFDPNKAWNIFLLVSGEPKKEIGVNDVVDLRTPGIERIRLMQRNVDNGEMPTAALRREFALLPVDVKFLDGTGLSWETVKDGERRWLVVHDYEVFAGYQPTKVTLALDIPKDYPQAQIDMFYFAPAVSRCDSIAIPNTHVNVTIGGVAFQGWSRHRKAPHTWDPNSDNVGTHFSLVEHSLAREFGE